MTKVFFILYSSSFSSSSVTAAAVAPATAATITTTAINTTNKIPANNIKTFIPYHLSVSLMSLIYGCVLTQPRIRQKLFVFFNVCILYIHFRFYIDLLKSSLPNRCQHLRMNDDGL